MNSMKLTRATKIGFWLVAQAPVAYLRLAINVPQVVIEMFGLKVHGRYLLVPMFHDTSWVGRSLSVFFRLAILASGWILWILITVLVWTMPLFLLLIPILGLIHSWWWWVSVAILGLLVFWRLTLPNRTWGKLGSQYSSQSVLLSLPDNLSNLIDNYPQNLNTWWADHDVRFWMARCGIDLSQASQISPSTPDPTQREQLLKEIYRLSQQAATNYPEIGEVMWALRNVDNGFRQSLELLNINEHQVVELAKWLRREIEWFRQYPLWDERFELQELAGTNRAMTGTPTPTLDQFSMDLTLNADRLPEAVDREAARDEVLKILSRQGNDHVMIIGEPGSGKTTFVGGLAQTIMRGGAPPQIANKRLVKLEPGRLAAGVVSQGQLAQRLVGVMEDIKRSGDILLFIDEIHTLLTADETSGGLNMFSVLEEALFSRDVQMISATSISKYKRFIEPNEAFSWLFEVVKLEEPNDDNALIILENVVSELERKHGVVISLPAVQSAIQLSRRYIHDRVLPDKGKGLMDEAALTAKGDQRTMVTSEDIAKVVTQTTGVPVTKIGTIEKDKLLNLEAELHQEFVDQELAVQAVSDALRRGRLDIKDQGRPVGAFMFVGPTGVGKTELARRLCQVYFGSEEAMIRLDMSEFSNADMVRRLVGSAAGESGYGEGGELTEKVRRQAAALILLDEIEKAHPKVWDLLMQVIEEGRLTDASGLKVDFNNTIIIMTSNAVTSYITDQLRSGKQLADLKDEIFDELVKTFRVEFLNRFDGIIPFGPLSEEHMSAIVKIQLEKLRRRLALKQVRVSYSDGLVQQLASQGQDARLGARPLRRLIQDKIESHIARKLLERDTEDTELKIDLDESVLA